MALEAAAIGLGAAGGGLETAFGVVALETALGVLAMSAPDPRTGLRPESTLAAIANPAPPATAATEPAGKMSPAEDAAAATGGAVLGALIAFFLAACTFSFSTAKAPPEVLLLLTAL